MKVVLFFLLTPLMLLSQNSIKGIVVDSDTKQPLEFVDVYTINQYTATNADGKYEITTNKETVSFNLIGYEQQTYFLKETTVADTVFLKSTYYSLDEVVLFDEEFSLKNYMTIQGNYPFEDYSEAFFLRISLKRNDSIVKLQDINGIVSRKQLLANKKNPYPKKNVVVRVANMRKAGHKEKNIRFNIWSFEELLRAVSGIAMSAKHYNFEEQSSKEKDKTRLVFKANEAHKNPFTRGHYIINSSDNAIEKFYLIQDFKEGSFKPGRTIKYRTVFYEVTVNFKKNKSKNLYYMDKAKVNATVEVFEDENLVPIIYSAEYIWIGLNQVEAKIKRNVSSRKDIFKLQYPYNEVFWQQQKLLLPTAEMKKFIKSIKDASVKSDYISNFN
ncbi:MAG: carboxypeptidase-like regulatory domain-containing protein [Cellulophaga sp.]